MIERSKSESVAVREELQASFPFLAVNSGVLDQLSKWQEWYIGELSDEVDPATYDSFSISPIEELHFRTERIETGLLPIGIFYAANVETDISVKTSGELGLYLWCRNGKSQPQLITTSFDEILDRLLDTPDNVQQVLDELKREATNAG